YLPRHTVGTAEVAFIRQGNAQITQGTLTFVPGLPLDRRKPHGRAAGRVDTARLRRLLRAGWHRLCKLRSRGRRIASPRESDLRVRRTRRLIWPGLSAVYRQ